GDPHPSTLPEFRGTRDPERSVTRSRSGMKKKRVKFEDVQPQSIPNPTQENFPRMCITQLPDGVSHIYYTGKELTNRDSMHVHDTFTAVFKVWKDIATIPAVRDVMVNIFGQFMEIRLGNSYNRLIQAFTERCHIKSGNVSIAHLRMYLTAAADRDDDITIARAFIFFMMGYLWFQTANDTVPLGYLAAVSDSDSAAQYDWDSAILASLYHSLDTAVTTGGAITGFVQLLPYWFYEYCGVGHPIVKEEDATLSTKRNCKYYLGDRCWRQVTGEVSIPLDPPLSIWPHISPTALHEVRQAGGRPHVDRFPEDGESRSVRLTVLRDGITPVVVMSASVHSLSQDFSLPGEAEGPDLGWHMKWTGRRERLPIARLRDPPPMSSSYGTEELWHLTHGMRRLVLAESARDARRLQEVEDELAIARKQIDNIDHQLYAHNLQLRRGRDVQVVPLPPRGGARTRQRGSGPRTRGGSTSRKGRGTGDDS
ncbi:hypothetical protein GIB67_038195, partial [Kingdonia uniflora]